MAKVKLYSTYEGKKVDLNPIKKDEVCIYYCGPTVYNYVHIGNMRPVVTFDLLKRVLEANNYKVHLISNYTDIDDKIIKKALEEKKTEKEVSDFYIKSYEDLLDKLNVLPLENHPRVSNYIPQIADFIADLIDKGYAYKAKNGDIYYDVSKDSKYGELSKIKLDDLKAGSRVEVNEEKHSPLDFALWKLTDDKGIKFDTKIGLGRPGWHTECVVMINSYFKMPTIDIHGGGFDLKFPHHENEIAQQEGYAHTHLANIWMHVGFINIDNEKMSKSLGNVILAKDAINKWGGNVIRYFFLTTSYRAPINYTLDGMETAKKEIDKYQAFLNKLRGKILLEGEKFTSDFDTDSYNKFLAFLSDDLNVANAITVIESLIKSGNVLLRKPLDVVNLSKIYNTLLKCFDILGFKFNIIDVTKEDVETYQDYLKAKADKNFELSDKYRTNLIQKGLI